MTKTIITTVHAITETEIADEEFENMMEDEGYDDPEEFIEETRQAARAVLSQSFDPDSLEMLEVAVNVEEDDDD